MTINSCCCTPRRALGGDSLCVFVRALRHTHSHHIRRTSKAPTKNTMASSSATASTWSVRISDTTGANLAEISMRQGDTVGTVRQKLLHQMRTFQGFPEGVSVRLCSDGAILSDDRQLLSPAQNEMFAWCPRYSQSVVPPAYAREGASAGEHARALLVRVSFDLRSLAAWLLSAGRTLQPLAIEAARVTARHPRMLAKLAVWAALFYFAHWRVELGGPFLVASACWAVWQVGFSERSEGEESAYTVFNGGRALPGQLRQEECAKAWDPNLPRLVSRWMPLSIPFLACSVVHVCLPLRISHDLAVCRRKWWACEWQG